MVVFWFRCNWTPIIDGGGSLKLDRFTPNSRNAVQWNNHIPCIIEWCSILLSKGSVKFKALKAHPKYEVDI